MFDIGMQELIVIFIVALLVFGPKRLPELARTIGKGVAEIKKAMYGVKEQMDAELHEIKNPPIISGLDEPESGKKKTPDTAAERKTNQEEK